MSPALPVPDPVSDPVSRPLPPRADLDARILHAEQRLIAREERLRRDLNTLGGRLRKAVEPGRWLVPAVGGLFAVASGWWLMRRSSPSRVAKGRVPGAHDAPAARGRRTVPWLRWLTFAWPMLPARWRSKVSPATATAVMSIGLPLAERFINRRTAPPLVTMPSVDLGRYAGQWFEIARLPTTFERACAGQPRTRYTLRQGAFQVENRCIEKDGRERVARGVARPVPGGGGAVLQVSFLSPWLQWLPFAWADYWILFVDDDYRVALVGSPDRDFLWLLSRSPRVPPTVYEAMVAIAAERGFAVDKLQRAIPT